jgi:nucleoside-diphosphate-sugar epimerase
MRVLVLGGTGLISTAIVKRLIETGHEPVLFNRGQTSRRFPQNVESITGDRQDFADFKQKMTGVGCDAVIDMITFDPRTAEHGVAVFEGKTSHYLFCSTVCVYGGPLSRIPADEYEPHTPVSAYGENKSKAEEVFNDAFQRSAFPVTAFRPSHCYGPGQPLLDIWGYNPALVNRMREGRPIIVPGDGYGLWQPGHVADMAKGFVGALAHDETKGKAYNIVGDEVMTWRAFHERMASAIGCEARIVPMTTPQILAGAPADQTGMLNENFQYHAAYSNARLKADVPEFSDLLPWEEGVRQTVQWMDEAGVHAPCDTQPWIDELAAGEDAFRASLRALGSE